MKRFLLSLFFVPLTATATGYLENPQPDSTQSGIGVISGWHCSARTISVFLNGLELGSAGSGTTRGDLSSVCGHTYAGFSLLFNFNDLEPGEHVIKVLADGAFLEERRFKSVRSGGVSFLQGAAREVEVTGFPQPNHSTRLQWSQSTQKFEVIGHAATEQSNIVDLLKGGWFDGMTYGISEFGRDSTKYRFNLGGGEFKLEREAFFSGTCLFNGEYHVSGNMVQSTGVYRCSDFSEGQYQAENLSISSLGLYTGVFYRRPKGGGPVVLEIHTGR